MKGRIFAGVLLCFFVFVVGGDAQRPDAAEKPVWTLEFIKPRTEKFGRTLGYLDDHWMRIRKEAKRQGAVLSYHCISETFVITGPKAGNETIVLMTEYKNPASFFGRENLSHRSSNACRAVRLECFRQRREWTFMKPWTRAYFWSSRTMPVLDSSC